MKNINKSYSWQLLTGIVLLTVAAAFIGISLFFHLKNNEYTDNKEIIDTPSQAINYLKKYSTIFTDDAIVDGKSMWPIENIIVDVARKQIIYAKGLDSLEINYTDIKKYKSCKKFIIPEESSVISDFRKALEQCSILPINDTYAKEIDGNKDLSEDEKKLSKLYNLLVGDTLAHVILGKDGNHWKLYQACDFPMYRIDTNRLRDFITKHRNNTKLTPHECDNGFIVVDKGLHVVYYNLRDEIVIEQDGKRKASSDPTLTHRLDLLKTYKGWMNFKTIGKDVTKWELESAYDYYVSSKRIFLFLLKEL